MFFNWALYYENINDKDTICISLPLPMRLE